MMKVLDKNNETQNGNQYFFLASTLLGTVFYQQNLFEQAHMFFQGTLNKQLRYVDQEADHPYLEQTYTHLAILYKTLKNY